MLKVRITLLLLSLINITSLKAQDKSVDGFIIKKNGTRITGQLDSMQWYNNPEQIRFAAVGALNYTLYSPKDISAVGRKDSSKIFVSAEVEVEMSPSITNDLTTDSDFKIEKRKVFLQVLVDGERSLYRYKFYGKINLYIKSNNEFKLLLYKKYISEVDGMRKVTSKKTYRGQLKYYLNDVSGINNMIQNADYSQKEIVSIFEFYKINSENNIRYIYQEPVGKSFSSTIYIGGSYTSINFASQQEIFGYLSDTEYEGSINFALGFGLTYEFNDKFAKLASVNELFLNNFSFTKTYYKEDNPDEYSNSEISIGFTYLKMNNLISYNFTPSSEQLKLFVAAGVTSGVFLSQQNEKFTRSQYYSTSRNYTEEAIPVPRRFELGFQLAGGLVYKKLTLQVRHEITNGMSQTITLSSRVQRTSALIGYTLK